MAFALCEPKRRNTNTTAMDYHSGDDECKQNIADKTVWKVRDLEEKKKEGGDEG